MNGADTIWVALEILMVVCVCLDMGPTRFSAIQAIGLLGLFLVLAYPGWDMWSKVLVINVPLELIAVCCTSKYRVARIFMALHVVLKLAMWINIDADIQLKENWIFWMTHYVNQVILMMLLVASARSFISNRSTNHVRERTRKAPTAGRTRRSSHSTPSPSHQLAFTKGLY